MQPRKKINLTIWQWPSGEVTAFLESLRIDGTHLDLQEPRLIAQLRLEKGAGPEAVLRALAERWEQKPPGQPARPSAG